MCYGVGGCALIRLLNHDGYKIYNVRIDNVIEVSPWSENDAPVAQNPDLFVECPISAIKAVSLHHPQQVSDLNGTLNENYRRL
jgi:hypothetical protein